MYRIFLTLIVLGLIATVSMSLLHAEGGEIISGEMPSILSGEKVPSTIPPPRQREQKFSNINIGFASRKYILNSFGTDSHILRFVSRDISLTDIDYKPENLVPIAGENINESGRTGYLRSDARMTLGQLAEAFSREFKTPLVVISGYRSATYQRQLWARENYCTETLCALPGRSEHQLGLAIDVFDATNEHDFIANRSYQKYVAWFQSNAHLYGWHQSYQKGVEVDGYMVEPWHWRYVGVDMATRLHNLKWTYTEYVQFQEYLRQWW